MYESGFRDVSNVKEPSVCCPGKDIAALLVKLCCYAAVNGDGTGQVSMSVRGCLRQVDIWSEMCTMIRVVARKIGNRVLSRGEVAPLFRGEGFAVST